MGESCAGLVRIGVGASTAHGSPMTSSNYVQSLITITAGDLAPGDLVFYNANVSWRVEGTAVVGKSIDVSFDCEQSLLVPADVGVGGVHRFRQSTLLLVMRDSTAQTPDVPVTIAADDLVVGDIIHYTASESWRVTGFDVVGKSLDTDFVTVRSESDPAAVGATGAHRFRRATNLLVSRS